MSRLLRIIHIIIAAFFLAGTFLPSPAKAQALEPVEGEGCYAYGDDETPSQAKDKAMARAREQAVSSYQVWVESSSEVENFQLKKDTIQSISAGMLRDIKTDDVVKKNQEVCISISAMIDPASVEEELARRKKQLDLQSKVVAMDATPNSAFGLKIWLNKKDGRYGEGDKLVVYVESDRDAFLKLDYFQADGTVVHLVPNVFRGQAFVLKGQTYEFGGEGSLEQFVISEPYGDEVIKAVASTKPFLKNLQTQQTISQSQEYVETLQRGLELTPRGIKVLAGASIALSTKSQAVLEHRDALEE